MLKHVLVCIVLTFFLLSFFLLSCETVSNEYVELALEYYKLGQFYEQESDQGQDQGQDQKPKAIEQYKRALEFYPGFEEAALALAVLYIDAKNYTLAEEVVNRLEMGAPRFFALQAYLALSKSDYEAAERFYLDIIAEEAAEYDTYYNLGLIYSKADREGEAVEMFIKTQELRSDYIPALEQLALVSFQNEEYANVIIGLEPHIDNLSEFPLASIMLGESFVQTENYVGLFSLMDNLYSAYEDAIDMQADLLERYQVLLAETARALATVALDDTRSLRYFTIVSEMGFLPDEEWAEILLSLQEITGIDETIAFVSALSEPEEAPESEEASESEEAPAPEEASEPEEAPAPAEEASEPEEVSEP